MQKKSVKKKSLSGKVLMGLMSLMFIVAISLVASRCGGSGASAPYSSSGVLGSPFISTSTSSPVIKGSRLFGSTYAERKSEIDALLAVKDIANCKFTIDLSEVSQYANCYGPGVTLTGTHPNTGIALTPTTLPTGDLGLWHETEISSTEACTAAQINKLIDAHAGRAHFANLSGAALYCFVNNHADLNVPTTAATPTTLTTDQLSDFSFVDGTKTYTATAASVSYITDSDSDNGLLYSVSGTVVDGAKHYTFKSVVRYINKASGVQKGTISYYIQDPTAANGGNCPGSGGGTSKTFAGRQIYNVNSASEVVIQLDHATFCGATDPLDPTDYSINPSQIYNASTKRNGWGDNWNYVLMTFDPRSTEATYQNGNYVFAWQAGGGDSHSRVFNATISTSGSNQVGTGYFGYGPKMFNGTAAHADRGKIEGMICNWAGPALAPPPEHAPLSHDFVQKQTMQKTSGIWVPVTSEIKYAAGVDNCSYNPGTYTYGYNTASGTYSNNSTIVAADETGDTIGLKSINDATEREGGVGTGYFTSFSTFPSAPTF